MDHDTSAFAVQSIRRWWAEVGRPRYPGATRLVITADGGGSNGSRVRLVETRITTPRQRTRPRHCRPSPTAGDQQMEQDRAPPFLVHHHELESSAAHQL